MLFTKKNHAGIAFIFFTIVLDMIGIGLIIPVLPNVIRRFVESPEDISTYFGYFISVYALMQFLVSPLLGAISDLWGRRAILLVSLFIAALDYLLMAFAPTLEILFIGRVIAGLTGANITVAMAYVADVSDDSNRSKNFGMIGAAFGLGFIIGPLIGGLVGTWGPQYPFVVAAVLNGFNFLFGLFILPESLPLDKRQKFSWQKMNPFYSLMRVIKRPLLPQLLLVVFFLQLAGQTHPSIWTLYTETRFGWTAAQVGFSLAVVGLLSAFAQGYLTGVIVPKLGEVRTVNWGVFGEAVTFSLFGFASTGWAMYLILVVSSVFWAAPPALQSLITKQVPDTEQGELQGSIVSLTSLASIVTPIVVTQLFSHFGPQTNTNPYIPGAPYYFAGLVCFIGWILFRRSRSLFS